MPIIGRAIRDAFEGSNLEGRDCDIWEVELGDLVPDVIPEEKDPFAPPPHWDPDEEYEDE